MAKKRKNSAFQAGRALAQIRHLAQTRLQPTSETIIEGPVHFRSGDSIRPQANAAALMPWSLRLAAEFSWRAIVVAVAAVGLLYVAYKISMILVPVAVALLFAVLLDPLLRLFTNYLKLGRTMSAALTLVLGVLFVVVLLTQAMRGIIVQLPQLFSRAQLGMKQVMDWLIADPLGLGLTIKDPQKLQKLVNVELTNWFKEHVQTVADGAISVTSTFATVAASSLITLFVLFFFLKDGRTIWLWIVRMLPEPAREPLHESAIRGWVTLDGYVRAQIKIAAIDAIGIGLGAFFLGLPMAVPITVVVFFGSFIPIVGALTSGAVAVFVAVVDQGLTAGAVMLVIILAVQQIEGNLLQPWIMSSAVSIHPVAVLLVVAGAGAVAGIPGALFGVPVAAFLNSTFLYLHGYDPIPSLRTDEDRPGGPPGKLRDMIEDSYRTVRQVPTFVSWRSAEGTAEVDELGLSAQTPSTPSE